MSKNDDKRKDKEKHENEECGSKKFFLLEDENKSLEHVLIYCTKRWNVKQLNQRARLSRGVALRGFHNK